MTLICIFFSSFTDLVLYFLSPAHTFILDFLTCVFQVQSTLLKEQTSVERDPDFNVNPSLISTISVIRTSHSSPLCLKEQFTRIVLL